MNKADLVSKEEAKKLELRLKTMNPAVKLYLTQQSHIEINQFRRNGLSI